MTLRLDPRDSSIVYLDHDLDGSFLYRVPRNAKGSWDVDRKNREFTFGKRSFWDPRFNTKDKSFYVTSDDFNDETFNTYRVDLLSGKLEQKTAFQYSPSYHFNADESAILSVGRMNKFGNDECLTETLLRSGQKVTIFYNDGHLKLYPFVCPQEDPNSGTIAAVLNLKGDRSQLNIGLFKRDGGRPKVITDDSQKHARLNLLGWYKEKLYFVGNNGKEPAKLYAYSLPDDKIEVVAEDAALETLKGKLDERSGLIFVVGRSKDDSIGKAIAVNLKTGEKRTIDTNDVELLLDGWGDFLSDGTLVVPGKDRKDGSRLLLFSVSSLSKPEEAVKIVFERKVLQAPPPAYEAKVVTYPTFDNDPATGTTRQIQAVLFTPKQKPAKKAGIVFAHGGPSGQTTVAGANEIDFLCSLGYTVLGPNPRGSSGQGQEFEDLNNGDWGGGDYKDYEYGRRYLVASEGIEPARVGIMGGSFGGYMTNWAMVQPKNEFGFGISDYGMADLLLQMRFSVVPDNTRSDLGDPETNKALYKERSPMTHAANINKPFLVTTGSRDNRCYYEDTRRFAAELKKHSDQVEYLELKGEGHGYRYPDTLVQYYQAVASFLFKVAPTE